jgi:hypothetical protein
MSSRALSVLGVSLVVVIVGSALALNDDAGSQANGERKKAKKDNHSKPSALALRRLLAAHSAAVRIEMRAIVRSSPQAYTLCTL